MMPKTDHVKITSFFMVSLTLLTAKHGPNLVVVLLQFTEVYHALFYASHPTLDHYGWSVALLCNSAPWRCYWPPQTHPDYCWHLNNYLKQFVATYPNAHILLFGDFNYPDIDWQNVGTSSLTCHLEAKNFIDVCLKFSFSQLVSQPTRITQ